MKTVTTIIIGAGQAGLAMSYHLNALSIDHVLLERGDVANSWRKERWDSLRLLTPNWQSRLPGHTYEGDDPHGFSDMRQTVNFLSSYAEKISAPIQRNTTVLSAYQEAGRYIVKTNRGDWCCDNVVIATGACNIANIPKSASALSSDIRSITPLEYRSASDIDPGAVMVVGASATGVQLALELQRSGRQVYLSSGEHVRIPRTYRGRDIQWWMDESGMMDEGIESVDDVRRVQRLPSLQLIGSDAGESIDFNSLQSAGVQITGRMMDIANDHAIFSGSLANVCKLADLKMKRLLGALDDWAEQSGLTHTVDPVEHFRDTNIPAEPLLNLNLKAAGVKTVLWATGYRPDYSWLDVPVLDFRGELRHQGGIVDAPGMYVMGLPFMRRRKSSLIDGVGDDARDLAAHMHTRLVSRSCLAA